MTVANNYAPVVAAANGTTTVFSGPWNAIAAANLVVQLLNTTTGAYTTVPQGVAANQYQVTSLTSTGFVITFNTAPAIGNNVVITRVTAPTQTIPYTTSRGFQGVVEEGSFDALTAMVQELNNKFIDSVQVSVGDTAENLVLPIASLRANSYLAFDASGNVVVAPGTGGGTTAPLVTYTAVGGVTRTLQAKLGEIITATDFGADPTNTVDSTSAIAIAINSLPFGGLIRLPNGTYKYSVLSPGTGVTLQGDGWDATTLNCTSATANSLNMGISSGIKDLQIVQAVTKTAGATINIQNNAVLVSRVSFAGYYQGILVGTNAGAQPVDVQILGCNFATPAVSAGGYGIFGCNVSNLVIDGTAMSGPAFPATQPDSGIRIQQADTVMVSNTNITLHGTALWLNALSGGYIGGFTAVNSFFDNAGTNSGGTTHCCAINGAGEVQNTKFTGVWFGLCHAQSGCSVLPVTGGTVYGITFTGCEFIANGDCGLIFGNSSGGTVKDLNVSGGGAGGNTNYGLRTTGCTGFSITGCDVGTYSQRGPNNYGIELDAAASGNFIISQNNVWGNTSAGILDNSTGSTGQIINNPGYNGVAGSTVVSTTASPMTYTSGHTPEILYFAGGVISSIVMDGNTVLNQTSASITLPPNQAITITYSVAPTIVRKRI